MVSDSALVAVDHLMRSREHAWDTCECRHCHRVLTVCSRVVSSLLSLSVTRLLFSPSLLLANLCAPSIRVFTKGRINELLKSVGDAAQSFSGFDDAVAPLDAALKKEKDSGAIAGNPTVANLIALLEKDEQAAILPVASATVQSVATATGYADGLAVARWKDKIEKEVRAAEPDSTCYVFCMGCLLDYCTQGLRRMLECTRHSCTPSNCSSVC